MKKYLIILLNALFLNIQATIFELKDARGNIIRRIEEAPLRYQTDDIAKQAACQRLGISADRIQRITMSIDNRHEGTYLNRVAIIQANAPTQQRMNAGIIDSFTRKKQ